MIATINGRKTTLPDGLTVADFLHQRDVAPVRVAVEINQDLITRSAYASTVIREGDQVEIVTFVGGG